MDIEQVLKEYRNGDESKRLSLFLAFRDLREMFERIELESEHEDFVVIRFPWHWHRKHRLAHAA